MNVDFFVSTIGAATLNDAIYNGFLFGFFVGGAEYMFRGLCFVARLALGEDPSRPSEDTA